MNPEDASSVARPMGLPLAADGFPLIGGTLAVALVFAALGWKLAAAAAFVLVVFLLQFFRDPERRIPADPSLILAPADGRVIKVADVHDDRFFLGDVSQVSIFMSPLDVHVNRLPIGGRVVEVRYNHGKYFRAFADKASLDNEQNAVIVEDERGQRVCFVQIAGFLARRIVCRLRPGMQVERGRRYGMIKLGSRADIFLPRAARVLVRVGDHTRAGETAIAQW